MTEKYQDYSKHKKLFWTIDAILLVLVVIFDQVSKFLIRKNIPIGGQVEAIPGIFAITNLKNTGAAWSLLTGHSLVFELLALAAIAVISYLVYVVRNNKWETLGLVLVLAGTIGNVLDRIFVGYVTDMIETTFINFPVFNIADASITIGVLILICAVMLGDRNGK